MGVKIGQNKSYQNMSRNNTLAHDLIEGLILVLICMLFPLEYVFINRYAGHCISNFREKAFKYFIQVKS